MSIPQRKPNPVVKLKEKALYRGLSPLLRGKNGMLSLQ